MRACPFERVPKVHSNILDPTLLRVIPKMPALPDCRRFNSHGVTRLFLVFSPNVVSVLGHDLPERGINNPNLQLLSSIANDLQGLIKNFDVDKRRDRRRDPIECTLGPLIIHIGRYKVSMSRL